jgi:hypothetical protein
LPSIRKKRGIFPADIVITNAYSDSGRISSGSTRSFGHPHPEVLERYSGTRVFRTDLDGAVSVRLSEDSLGIDTERRRRRRYWHDAAL